MPKSKNEKVLKRNAKEEFVAGLLSVAVKAIAQVMLLSGTGKDWRKFVSPEWKGKDK